MNRNLLLLIIFLFFEVSFLHAQNLPDDSLIYSTNDKILVENKLHELAKYSALPINDLLVEVGKSFMGTPYVSATLENGIAEKLVINLRELDCTTFVENVLALSRIIKAGKTDFSSFAAMLQRIRYRDGIRHGYPSRLHYFSEWITNNQEKHIVDGTINKNGKRIDKPINYMSTHPSDYPVLKEHPELIKPIAIQENELSKHEFWYFPKTDFVNLYKNLKHGDIIALTSTIDGVDVNHVGIIVKKENEFYLLHAPLSGKMVLISEKPITDFLRPTSKNSGIMIVRPLF